MPNLGRVGAEGGRFALLGFATTFLGVFVSATGTLLAPFVASATPDRRVHAATMGALMAIAHVAKLVAFGFIGFAIGSFVPLMAAMIAAGAVGNWLGEVALNYTSELRFRLVLQLVLTALGLHADLDGGAGARVVLSSQRNCYQQKDERACRRFYLAPLAGRGRTAKRSG